MADSANIECIFYESCIFARKWIPLRISDMLAMVWLARIIAGFFLKYKDAVWLFNFWLTSKKGKSHALYSIGMDEWDIKPRLPHAKRAFYHWDLGCGDSRVKIQIHLWKGAAECWLHIRDYGITNLNNVTYTCIAKSTVTSLLLDSAHEIKLICSKCKKR